MPKALPAPPDHRRADRTGRALARPGRAPACEPARKRGNSALTGAAVNRTDRPALFPSDSRISSKCAERPAGLCCVGGANRPVAEPAGEFFSAPPIPRYSVVAAPSFFPPKRGPQKKGAPSFRRCCDRSRRQSIELVRHESVRPFVGWAEGFRDASALLKLPPNPTKFPATICGIVANGGGYVQTVIARKHWKK